jgi:hypothetical protein
MVKTRGIEKSNWDDRIHTFSRIINVTCSKFTVLMDVIPIAVKITLNFG